MKHVISIASGKGGVGKTTLTANLAVCLAELGNRVLVIDGDFGLRNLDIMLGLAENVVYDISNVILGDVPLAKALVRLEKTDVYLLAAPQLRDTAGVSAEQLCNFIKTIYAKFDYCLIDCPAGVAQGLVVSASPADLVLLVVTPEAASIRDTDRTAGVLEKMNKHNYMLVINRVRPELIKKGKMQNVADVVETLGIATIGIIPESKKITESSKTGIVPAGNKRLKIHIPFINIAKRIEGEAVPVIKINKRKWRKA